MTSTQKQNRQVLIAAAISIFAFIAIWILLTLDFKTEWNFKEYNDGIMLMSYKQAFFDKTENVEIPSTHEGKNVIAINDKAFYKNRKIKSVKIPDTVTEMGSAVFKKCSNLTSVEMGKNIEVMGGECFGNCKSLVSLVLPDSLKELRGETFINCSSLTSVVLPKNITEIKGNTFENCKSLISIDIPIGVTRIAAHAFYGCSSLSSVYVPDTVVEIGSSAFRKCDSLEEIELPSSVTINERAFKESPTKIKNKVFTDKQALDIIDEVNAIERFDAHIVYEKGKPKDEVFTIDGYLYITSSDKFSEAYPKFETVLLEDDELQAFLDKAKTEGCKGAVFAMFSELGTKIKGSPHFLFTDTIDMDTVIELAKE